jgi:hypothetical protein
LILFAGSCPATKSPDLMLTLGSIPQFKFPRVAWKK